jgi:hypothetical protein
MDGGKRHSGDRCADHRARLLGRSRKVVCRKHHEGKRSK